MLYPESYPWNKKICFNFCKKQKWTNISISVSTLLLQVGCLKQVVFIIQWNLYLPSFQEVQWSLPTGGHLMQVLGNAENFFRSFLHYFQPALSVNPSDRLPIFLIYYHLTRDWLYVNTLIQFQQNKPCDEHLRNISRK